MLALYSITHHGTHNTLQAKALSSPRTAALMTVTFPIWQNVFCTYSMLAPETVTTTPPSVGLADSDGVESTGDPAMYVSRDSLLPRLVPPC